MKPSEAPLKPASIVSSGQTERSGLGISECWNEIGIFGNRSCQELAKAVHCHNCPVFGRAGASLLDQPLPADYVKDWTEYFSRARELNEPGNISALIFRIQSDWFALPTSTLQEITEHRTIHSLPHRRQGSVLGVANIRGELLVCVSLGQALGIDINKDMLRRCHPRLLVTSWNGSRLGIPVDEVGGTERFHMQDVHPAPAKGISPEVSFMQGVFHWRQWSVGMLNPELLFASLNGGLG